MSNTQERLQSQPTVGKHPTLTSISYSYGQPSTTMSYRSELTSDTKAANEQQGHSKVIDAHCHSILLNRDNQPVTALYADRGSDRDSSEPRDKHGINSTIQTRSRRKDGDTEASA